MTGAPPTAATARSLAATSGSGGLVHETNYYASTSAGRNDAGGAAGYQAYQIDRQVRGSLSPVYSVAPVGGLHRQRQHGRRLELHAVFRAQWRITGHGRHRRRHADDLSLGRVDDLRRFQRHPQPSAATSSAYTWYAAGRQPRLGRSSKS